MRIQSCTELVITELIDATYGVNLSAREKYVFTETLRSLVRLAKSEQIAEIKNNVRKLTAVGEQKSGNRVTKAKSKPLQGQLEFNPFD